MKFSFKKVFAAISAAAISFSAIPVVNTMIPSTTTTVSAASAPVVENLDRGITAIQSGNGMFISWRFLASDPDGTVFQLYRDDNLIYTSEGTAATSFYDEGGSTSSTYRVDSVVNGAVQTSDNCTLTSGGNYFDIPMDVPTSSNCTYSPNDCSVGDVDGDGVYEVFVKWDPSNSQDNSKSGKTDKVYIDCYKLNGTKLWRIDLGWNIRAGAHYTQFLVADFDCDGYAEMTCKTADGTVDGQGNVIGDASQVYRNSKGYILSGPEYYTLFDGLTGKALDTVDYEPARGTVSKWGDSYGNRCDRFLGAVMYLDGVRPSAVTVRGYYTRMTACAYDVVDDKLVKRWYFDTGNSSSATGYGDGNHNCMPADVDGDGKQELILGGTCLDDDGTVLWCTNLGHGDALHVGDLLPNRSGIEAWVCHEVSPYGVTLLDGKTGSTIFHVDHTDDTGRCGAGNIWAGNDGGEFWGMNSVFDGNGNILSCRRPALNFLSYWDGDLEREVLDGYTDSPATITDMGDDGKLTTILSTDGYYTCNTTKGTPCLSADIFGDWREEVIVRAADSKSIRIFTTDDTTDYRITTLMHDPQYRNQVAGQNVAYNQPPHTSFYLGSDEDLPPRPSVTVNTEGGTIVTPSVRPTGAVMDTSVKYMFKNVGSGLYLEVENAAAENGAYVQQWGADGDATHNTWKLIDAGDGYYYIRSCLGDGKTYFLDIDSGMTDNGTKVGIWENTASDAQLFKFVDNGDGTFTITTKVTEDKSCLGVASDSLESGARIIEWERNYKDSQKWTIETITIKDGAIIDESQAYMIKNVNSSLYMEVESGTAAAGTNVQQWGAYGPSAHNVWYVKAINWGYYYIYSALGDGQTFLLNVDNGDNGENVSIAEKNGYSSQYFKFVDNEDGTYTIVTRASRDLSCVEIAGASTGSGGNVQQWEWNGNNCQKWILEPVDYTLPAATTTAITETTTTITQTTTTITETTTTEPPVDTTTASADTTTTPAKTTTTTVPPQSGTDTSIPQQTTTTATTGDPDSGTSNADTTTTPAETTTTTVPPQSGTDTSIPQQTTTTATTGDPDSGTSNNVCGDTNLDGVTDLLDMIMINKHLAGIITLPSNALLNGDCNGDGIMNDEDSGTLMSFLLMIVTKLPHTA